MTVFVWRRGVLSVTGSEMSSCVADIKGCKNVFFFVGCFYDAAVESERDGRMDRRPKFEKYGEGVGESELLAWLLGLMASLAGRKSFAHTHTQSAWCYSF